MANKLISQMGLPLPIANVFAARSIITAKDALSIPESDLMALLDLGRDQVASAVARISEITCPPYQTVLSLMEDRRTSGCHGGRLPTLLKGLDEALGGGIPPGLLTELVGPSGIGKTQFCLKLSLIAALPTCYGGLNGRVIYIDTESKFSSRRIIEIGENSFPQIFQTEGMAQEMAGRIVVLRPASLSEFTQSLEKIKLSLIQREVNLLIIDSMAGLISGNPRENESCTRGSRQQPLGWTLSFLKSVAEFSRIPIVVTNQVRGQSTEAFHYPFEGLGGNDNVTSERLESHLVAALGIQWAHAVTIRLVLEAHSGQRYIKVAKSPYSPPLAFPFIVDSSGIVPLSDDGIELTGQEISTIRFQGCGT
ncbi:ATP diphosphatase protein [Dioscorea alata]|uniref:ATP diphosphatase protein n=1 Tax=Dioscorea alata TaxID=55571 RepID=A0ACB7V326_DIOAL|nr:ATP diphosphatase protein [Dioscorea alata]